MDKKTKKKIAAHIISDRKGPQIERIIKKKLNKVKF